MNRRPIAVLGITIAIASTTAFAQDGAPPDFSPMKPKNFESSQQAVDNNNASEEDAQLLRREPTRSVPGVSTYEAPPPAPAYGAPHEPYVAQEPARVRAAPPPTTAQATIDHGLFNRTGVNDFGA